MSVRGMVFDIQRFSIHDGPGIRTTVFLKGCPLACAWCHNPEGIAAEREHSLRANRCTACGACVSACERGAVSIEDGRAVTDVARCVFCGRCVEACPSAAREIVGRHVTVDEVLAEIERDVIFYDESGGGATFSGAARRIHTAVDTTCHAPWKMIDSIRGHVDLFLCDIKHMDPAEHERLTGVDNELILANLRKLAAGGEEIVIRIPIVPGRNDGEENLAAAGEFIASLKSVRRVDLLPYNEGGRGKLDRLGRAGAWLDIATPSRERMSAIAAKLAGRGLSVTIGG
jgi:pyruvate formate lyase activating enzyme